MQKRVNEKLAGRSPAKPSVNIDALGVAALPFLAVAVVSTDHRISEGIDVDEAPPSPPSTSMPSLMR